MCVWGGGGGGGGGGVRQFPNQQCLTQGTVKLKLFQDCLKNKKHIDWGTLTHQSRQDVS